MIKKIRSKLSIKVFLLTAVLMLICSSIVCLCIFRFAPYIYKYNISDMELMAPEFSEVLSYSESLTDLAIYAEGFTTMLSESYNDEYRLHIFTVSGKEIALPLLDSFTGKSMYDFSPQSRSSFYPITLAHNTQVYTMCIAQNTEKQSQVTEALYKTLPILSMVVFFASVLAAFICSLYMTAPVKKVSKMAKQMADMDFSVFCPTGRADEIGILTDSLNKLSQRLAETISELQDANQKLLADIDMERQLERQRTTFFSAASHELKTPITIIKGQLQGMLYQVGRYKDRDTYLAQALSVTDALEKTVQELLLLSRLSTPEYICHKCRLNLSALLNERLAAYEDWFMQKELTVEKTIAQEIFVLGDGTLLQKALDNLLGNAATYSPAGNRVLVRLWTDNGKVKLTIENTGVHIPDEDIPRLFEAFYRVDSSRNRQTGGTGLGLYIVKTALDLHGADIELANTAQGVMCSIEF